MFFGLPMGGENIDFDAAGDLAKHGQDLQATSAPQDSFFSNHYRASASEQMI